MRLFVHDASRGVRGAWLERTTMPSHLKNLVHARMEKTGESYQQALRHVRAGHDEAGASQPDSRVRAERLDRSRTVADTAFSIAVVRAEEGKRPPAERLFDDPYASFFAAAGAHAAESTQRFLDLPFFHEGVRLRTRYIDDAVRDGLEAGLDQVVLLGAGFDARGLRMPEIAARRASVYEIDTGEQLARKRKVLAAAGVRVPARIRYVPFDFDRADFETGLASALEAKGFRRGEGAVFVWEGVIGYIGNDEIDRSLRFMASEGGPLTRVVFTFAEGTFDPGTSAERTRRAGFRSCEEVGGDDLWRRYFGGDPYPHAFVMKLGTAIV
jgi:methyltransferase (TIGR00027 family)